MAESRVSFAVRSLLAVGAVVAYMALWVWYRRSMGSSGNIGLYLVKSGGSAQVRVKDLIRAARQSLALHHSGDLERAALLGAKTFREARGEDLAVAKQRKPLLCATFTTSGSEALEGLRANMEQMLGHCEWAVLFYDAQAGQASVEAVQRAASKVGAVLVKAEVVPSRQSVLDAYGVDLSASAAKFTGFLNLAPPLRKVLLSDDNFSLVDKMERTRQGVRDRAGGRNDTLANPHNQLVYPKSLQFLSLLELLPRYQRIWLLDADISLGGFRPDRFLLVAQCAFETPPLVAQPLIAERTQSYKYLNADGWKSEQLALEKKRRGGAAAVATGKPPPVLATASAFVEIQAPLLDAVFFEWFLRFLVLPLAAPSHILGADWGFDALFCRAAALFAAHSAAAPEPGGRAAAEVGEVCLVVIAGTPVHHVDRRVLDGALGRDVKKVLNKALMHIIAASFPSLYKSGHDKDANMLRPEHADKYRRSERFLGRHAACTHRSQKKE